MLNARTTGLAMVLVAVLLVACTGPQSSDSDVALPGQPPRDTPETVAADTTTTTIDPPVCEAPVDDPFPAHAGSWAPAPDTANGLSRVAHVEDTRLILSTAGGPADFVTGINLGATVPNYTPGQHAVTREDYRRWFPAMADLGFRAIRIYTVLPPDFYEELVAYNLAHPSEPLYLMQGAWIPEDRFLAGHDLYDPALVEEMKTEIDALVGVVTGDTAIAERLGHASGTYTADVTPWLYSWSLGIEWDPVATLASDDENGPRTSFAGAWFETIGTATPTEAWIAEMLDHLAARLARHGVTMPLSFVNWPTTDPLLHPDEPRPNEDQVQIDANAIQPTKAWAGGYFAAYHAYPYYPDFLRYEAGIADCVYKGNVDPYAGYLMALRNHHADLPVVVTEFGVPSAPGMAHRGPLGRHQGGLSEQEAMAINSGMLRIIHDLGLAGGFLFEWTDEWFKTTWNVQDLELPSERRPLWMNPWNAEGHYGMVAVEPGDSPVVIVDGQTSEWSTNESQIVYESTGRIREIRATNDPGYLYLVLMLDRGFSWESEPITLGFDVIEGGRDGLPGHPQAPDGADYAITIGPGEAAQVWVRGSNDPHTIRYGVALGYFDVALGATAEGSGVWFPYVLITNPPQALPSLGISHQIEVTEVGRLRFGTTDPTQSTFDSRAMWSAGPGVLELRIPYLAIGVSDPSSRQVYRVGGDGTVVAEPFGQVGITVTIGEATEQTRGYSWAPWHLAEWRERIKVGADGFAETARAVNGQ